MENIAEDAVKWLKDKKPSFNEAPRDQKRLLATNMAFQGTISSMGFKDSSVPKRDPENTGSRNENVLGVDLDAKCGKDVSKDCFSSPYGRCCSQYGFCGESIHHCSLMFGCQKNFGLCLKKPYPTKDGH